MLEQFKNIGQAPFYPVARRKSPAGDSSINPMSRKHLIEIVGDNSFALSG
jgi:hypothetical protein